MKISQLMLLLEMTSKGIVIPLKAGWSDVGSWKVIWENSTKDHNGNHLEGNVILEILKILILEVKID